MFLVLWYLDLSFECIFAMKEVSNELDDLTLDIEEIINEEHDLS